MDNHYSTWHKTFPKSGVGKQYPYLLEQITQNRQTQTAQRRQTGKFFTDRKKAIWRRGLDYGCGKGGTISWLQGLCPWIEIQGYDPGHDSYNTVPEGPFDFLYTADVLEHVDICRAPAGALQISQTIKHCESLSKINIHIIDLTPAKKHLPDGRNAHITLLDKHAWIDLFREHDHKITHITQYSTPDPNFKTRDRLCITTKHSTMAPLS